MKIATFNINNVVRRVLAGDYNVVPTDADIFAVRPWARDALLQPAPRAAYHRLLDQGWADALRELHAEQAPCTFWDYKREACGMRAFASITCC